MIKRTLNLAFVALGIGFFVKMVLSYDLAAIWRDISVVRWNFLWILLLWLLFLAADTVTFRHSLGPDKRSVGYLRLGLIMAAGQSINNVAPSGNLGELVKGKYLAEDLGHAASVSALIIFNFMCLAGSVAMVGIGAVWSLFLPQVPALLGGLLLAAAAVLLAWFLLILFVTKQGAAEKVVRLIKALRVPLRNPEALTDAARRIDLSVVDFRARYPRDFWVTVASQAVSRGAAVAEVYLICLFLGRPTGVGMAFFIMSVSQILFWLFSMIPSQIGVMEQSSDALFGAMAYQPGAGFAFELVRRARRLAQVAFGLLVLLLLSLRSGSHQAAARARRASREALDPAAAAGHPRRDMDAEHPPR